MNRRNFILNGLTSLAFLCSSSFSAYSSNKKNTNDNKNSSGKDFDVIIIGAGFGGLCSALQLIKHGKKICIIEKREQAGGRCSSINCNNFRMDVGCKMIPDFKTKKLIDTDYKIKEIDSMSWYSPYGKLDSPLKNINEIKFLFEKLNLNIQDYVQLSKCLSSDKKKSKSVEDLYSNIENSEFRNFLEMIGSLWYCEQPHLISSSYHISLLRILLMGSFHYPSGGTSSFIDSIKNKLEKNNVIFKFNTSVKSIIHENGLIKGVLTDKEILKSDIVVSNTTIKDTFLNMGLKEFLNQKEQTFLKRISPSHSIIRTVISYRKKLNLKKLTYILPDANFRANLKSLKNNYYSNKLPVHVFYDSLIDPDCCNKNEHLLTIWSYSSKNNFMNEKDNKIFKNDLLLLIKKWIPDFNEDDIIQMKIFNPSEIGDLGISPYPYSVSPTLNQFPVNNFLEKNIEGLIITGDSVSKTPFGLNSIFQDVQEKFSAIFQD